MFDEFLTWVSYLFLLGYCLYLLLKALFYVFNVKNVFGRLGVVISFLVLIILGIKVKELCSEDWVSLVVMLYILLLHVNFWVELDKKLKNVFGRCSLIIYCVMPFLYFFYIFTIYTYTRDNIPIIDELDVLIFVCGWVLFHGLIYVWCYSVAKFFKNVFGRRGIIIYCVISSIIFIAYIAHIVRELLA